MSLLVRRRDEDFLPSLISDFFSEPMPTSVFGLRPRLSEFDDTLVIPDVNLVENDNGYRIELATPGLDRKDIKVEVDNGVLTLSAEKKEETRNYRRREFSYNSFCRSFSLPEDVLSDKIDAKYENGILSVTLPKQEVSRQKARKEIKVA